ncbi:SRPBCC family protein [Methylovirgula sp. HY1]|uniref:SRPBCC family protein n=1 Tax=Methylovirgula sp. HY1 TaxID=2822761 RepID=UPI001C5B6BC3|nr:SRPBCC family protein [Methylovirgula sp. HY1]QXX73377.1 hypothetical protein MHY1_00173 [Methylovirgula sp. HY1]
MNKSATLAAASTAALLLSCLSAAALESRYEAPSAESAAAVWKKVGGFCGIANWHPAIAKCVLSKDGKDRTLSLKGGGTIIEHLVSRNNKKHTYTYKIVKSPLPVAHYISTIKVEPKGKGSEVIWSGKYMAKGATDAEAKKTIDGIYKSGVDSLAK